MGYAKIIMGVEEHRERRHRERRHVSSSEQIISKLEKRLRKDGIAFVEDCEENVIVVRWGKDLTDEERQEILEETQHDSTSSHMLLLWPDCGLL